MFSVHTIDYRAPILLIHTDMFIIALLLANTLPNYHSTLMLTNVTKLPATNTPGYLLLRLLFFRNKFTNTHLVASLYRVDRRDYRISSLHLFSSELNQSRERQRVREKGLRESDYCPFLPCLRLSVEPFRLCGLAALRGRPERLLGQRQP